MPLPSKKVRLDLFNNLKQYPYLFLKDNERSTLLDFLTAIWDLRLMPSTDSRFPDAYGDIYQHMVNNDDWSFDELFIERLGLLDLQDDVYQLFLELLVSPTLRRTEDEIFRWVLFINDHIDKDGLILALDDYTDTELPIHKLRPKSAFEHSPSDLKSNTIRFYVQKELRAARSDSFGSHTRPTRLPAFVLTFNAGWNDYHKRTMFDLFHYGTEGQRTYVGPVKIIYENSEAVVDDENSMLELMPNQFLELNEKYCSLGSSESYYSTLKSILRRDLESVLYAMRDIAFFPENRENFETNSLLRNSLFRDEGDERLSRDIRYRLYGFDMDNLYKFRFFFKPPYAEDSLDINFEFSGEGEIPSRIFAIIGKNGAGKTQLISSLPLHISKKEDRLFSPRAPLFSKVIAVSYSIFDRFELPRRNSSFNYVYCGLRKDDDEVMTERGQTMRFHNTWKKIQRMGRVNKWKNLLLQFIEPSLVNEMIVPRQGQALNVSPDDMLFEVHQPGVVSVRKKLSSGQNILLSVVSEIVANIMYDSLILFDEPETHLHPNAVSQIINMIYELVTEFQSYCIIATHSPIVIRELFSKNVFVIERHENVASIRRIGMESFGENLSILTEEVFGNREIPKHYKSIIERLVSSGNSFEQIIDQLQATGSPLSLNTRIYLKSLMP